MKTVDPLIGTKLTIKGTPVVYQIGETSRRNLHQLNLLLHYLAYKMRTKNKGQNIPVLVTGNIRL